MMPAIGTPVAANTSLGASLILLPCLWWSASGGRSDAWWYTALCWRERAIRLGTIAPPISCFIMATLISECVDSNASTKFLCLLSVGEIVLRILQIIFFLAHWTINSNLPLNTLNSHVKNIAIVFVDARSTFQQENTYDDTVWHSTSLFANVNKDKKIIVLSRLLEGT